MLNLKLLFKNFLHVIRPRFSFHYVAYTTLVSVVAFSIFNLVFAATPNPGHDWSGVGDGTFVVTGPTVSRTYTFPDANATVLTSNALVAVGQGGTGVGTLASNGILYGNGAGAVQALAVNSGATLCLTQASSGAPAWGACGGISDGDKGDITVSGSGAAWSIDTGAVTNTMLAGSIAYSKLSLTAAVLNADLAGSITASKLVGTDISTVGTLTAGSTGAGFTLALGSSTITGTLGAANGGTGNGFTAFSGPTTSTKTFTLPNASATILTSNAAVTVGQGGTGATSAGITAFNNITGYSASGATGTTSTNLVFSGSPIIDTPTFSTSATSPLLIGGTGTTSTLTLRSTSGVGTTGADIVFQTGSSGGTEAMRILNSGNIGVGTASPSGRLDVSAGLGSQTAGDLVVDTANNIVYVGKLDSVSGNTNFIFRDRLGSVKSRWENAGSGSIGFSNFSDGYGIRIGPTISGSIGSIGTQLLVQSGTGGTANPTAIFKASSSQTGDLQQWQNSAGNPMVTLSSLGSLNFKTNAGGSFGYGSIGLNGTEFLFMPGTGGINFAKDISGNSGIFMALTSGNVGFNTKSPEGLLHVKSTSLAETGIFERTTANTNALNTAGRLIATSNNDIVDGFGPSFTLYTRDSANTLYTQGFFGSQRAGGDTTSDFVIATNNAGSAAVRWWFKAGGKFSVNTSSPDATFQTNTLTPGTVAEIIRGASSQTADLTQWQSSAGAVLSTINANGYLGVGNSSPSALVTIGTAGTTAGTLSLAGATSGTATIQVSAAAGTPTLTLPTATGTLIGTGNISEIAGLTVGQGGTGASTFASNGILYGNGTGAVQALSVNTGATLCLTQASSGTPAWGSCGGGGGGSGAWSDITVPTADLTLAHGAYKTAFSFNSVSTGSAFGLSSSSLSSGSLLDLAITGTAGLTNQKGLNVSLSGTNGTGSQTTYGGYFSNTHTGTSNNVGLYTTASGGSSNLALNIDAGQMLIGGTTLTSGTLSKLNIVSTLASNGSTTAIAGIHGDYTFNNGGSSSFVQVGNRFVFNNAPTTNPNTMVGEIIRTVDNTTLANLVRGIEIVSNAGSNTAGTNTGLRATGATFGIQAITNSSAGGVSSPVGLYAENTGTTQGGVARFYTGSMTSASSMVNVYHDTSVFTGDALLMDMAVSSGTFSGDFLDLKNAGVSKFKVTNSGVVNMGLSSTSSTNAVCSSLANGATPAAGTSYEIRDCNSAPAADYAEMYPVSSGVEFGDIVAVGTKMVNTYDTTDGNVDWTKIKGKVTQLIKSEKPYQNDVIGIVVDNYGDFTSAGHNIKANDNPMPVALNGRVPVKISTTSESILPGDYITTSSESGKGIKATKGGFVIGKALESWDSSSGSKTVMVYVEQGFYNGQSLSEFAGLSIDDNLFAKQVLQKFMTSQNNIGSSSELTMDIIAAGLEIITPKITTNELSVSTISAGENKNIGLVLGENGKFTISGSNSNPAITVDHLGSSNFEGLVSFSSGVTFGGVTEFIVPPLYNKDTAGYALIRQGGTKVRVVFTQPYVSTPVVNTSITFEEGDGVDDYQAMALFAEDIRFIVVDKSSSGFTILLNKSSSRDIRFSWNALSVRDPNVFEDIIEGLEINPPISEPSPDPVLEPTSDTVIDTSSESVSDSISDPVLDSTSDPAIDSTSESESVSDSTSDPVMESASESDAVLAPDLGSVLEF